MKKLLFFALLASLSLSSCATIVNGSNQNIMIDSEPQGAEIIIREKLRGATPMELTFKRDTKDYVVTLRKDGYKDVDVELRRTFNGWFIGNIIFGGVIGMVIDAATGAMWVQDPGAIKVNLVPEADVNQP